MQNTENILSQEIGTTAAKPGTYDASIQLTAHKTVSMTAEIAGVCMLHPDGRRIEATINTCRMNMTEADWKAVRDRHKDEPREVSDKDSRKFADHEVHFGTVPDDSDLSRTLIIAHMPEYRVMGLVRESHAEQDKADLIMVYTANLFRGEVMAFYEKEPIVLPVSDKDPRALTSVYNPELGRIVYRVRQSQRFKDTRVLTRKLAQKYASIKKDPAGMYLHLVTVGGGIAVSLKGGTDHAK
jgi:hypothetical protein